MPGVCRSIYVNQAGLLEINISKRSEALISVIVPIYMIEQYLGFCIESILNQTYTNLEIILVDDGSKDRCPDICDLYAKKDSRIKVIHKDNGGLVSARKAGLQIASGQYIGYVDGDDWVEKEFYENMYCTIKASGADMVCAGYTRELFDKSEQFLNTYSSGVYYDENLKHIYDSMISEGSFYRPGIYTYVWNKLFKRKILYSVQMNVDNRSSIGEDAAVTYPALLKCNSICITDNTAYHYRQHNNSMLKKNNSISNEILKLKYLYEYMRIWAETESRYPMLSQIEDFILSVYIIRSGGQVNCSNIGCTYFAFDEKCIGKSVVIYSAGTFGQQLLHRLKETGRCKVAGGIDDDYWEYRRCCLDVDSVESIIGTTFDYVLIAAVDPGVAFDAVKRLLDLGVSGDKLLTVSVPEKKEQLIRHFLDVEALKAEKKENVGGGMSHE